MKKLCKIILISIILLSISACFKRDSLEGIDIYTTVYPIEYITNRLYKEHSNIHSIYPDGIIVDNYHLTDKQIKDYSKSSLFVFNALSEEKDYVIPMFNHNKHIKIIDSSLTMTYDYGVEELWLNPSNFLMMTQNIRMGFKDYINNHYLKNEIDENYEKLYIEVSNLDANLKQLPENATNNVIVVSNNVFKFLEKYNFNVISLEETEQLTDKTIADVKQLIKDEIVNYIFLMQHEEINDTIQKLIDETEVEVEVIHSITNLTENERSNNLDYISLMNENIEKLKNELYD
ncbi:MAG: metal ABC transporter substrate-binding protein [Bacilli bacterium]|nr:metal ABC transporter substrate-binding protein [Bacilli bacterium]MDD4282683.1 metal ABC transporter substrate-binding protein [Bacilli bacterium]MDD4719089.1 metal ABC transporter substrate-binding protein [Bacilli bacterium]